MAADDELRYDRRSSDRYLARIERDIRDLRDKLEQLDREGSRAVGVLIQQVKDADTRRVDLVTQNERAHDLLSGAVKDLENRLDRIDQVVIKANLEKLPERVDALEDVGSQRHGLASGVKTAIGIYAAVGIAFGGLVLQVVLK